MKIVWLYYYNVIASIVIEQVTTNLSVRVEVQENDD